MDNNKRKHMTSMAIRKIFVAACLCLANQTGVDLTEALQKSFEKKTKRDKDRHRHNPKLKA